MMKFLAGVAVGVLGYLFTEFMIQMLHVHYQWKEYDKHFVEEYPEILPI